jgi:hypothetical protein
MERWADDSWDREWSGFVTDPPSLASSDVKEHMRNLVSALSEGRVILFVGAGVSKNLGIPDFRELIDFIAGELGFEPREFARLGDYLTLAEYYRIRKGTLRPLLKWLERKSRVPPTDIAGSRIHELIVRLGCRIVYTTNYDRWLEAAYEHHRVPCKKIIHVRDIPQTPGDAIQIVKFHGDFEDPDSVVLAESSFFKRLSFEGPLDIKLRADALGKSILFIGYSLTDINIRYLLYKLHIQWAESEWAELRPRSFIFLARPNPVQEFVLREMGIHSFVSETEDPGEGLKDFLEELVRGVGEK